MLMRRAVPTGLAVALATVKAALRAPNDDDARLTGLIQSEQARFGAFCGRVMVPTEFRLSVSSWRSALTLPVTPVREVTAVTYLDAEDTETPLGADEWFAVDAAPFVSVHLEEAFARPALSLAQPWPVRIDFTAGYDAAAAVGEDGELAPRAEDQEAIILMVGRIYDQGTPMPEAEMRQVFGVRRLLA